MSNVIIHRYITNCMTVTLPPGLADFLKGTIYLYQESVRGPEPYTLVVDFSQHPMGPFIKPQITDGPLLPYVSKSMISVTECFNYARPIIRDLVQKLQQPTGSPGEPTIYYTICHEPYTDFDSNAPDVLPPATQQFMRGILRFQDELVEAAQEVKERLGLHEAPYAVLHLRMGDGNTPDGHAELPRMGEVERYIEETLIPRWGKRILVLSDSHWSKQYLCDKYGLKMTPFYPIHMGAVRSFVDRQNLAEPYDIANTLIEFILMSGSQCVYIYSIYGWNSGFSKVCCHIYGIPYVSIAQKSS